MMRKLILKMSMSLDGFVGGPNGEMDWIFRTPDKAAQDWTMASISNASLHIMGSRTYHDMVSWWPYSEEPFAAPMNAIPKAVFTRRGAASLAQAQPTQAVKDAGKALEAQGGRKVKADPVVLAGWREPYVAADPMADEIGRLKQADGKPIVAHGGAGFARSLIATGLIDEYRLLVRPVALGRGLPIFSDLSKPQPLKLVSATPFPGGAVAQIYHPGEALRAGS